MESIQFEDKLDSGKIEYWDKVIEKYIEHSNNLSNKFKISAGLYGLSAVSISGYWIYLTYNGIKDFKPTDLILCSSLVLIASIFGGIGSVINEDSKKIKEVYVRKERDKIKDVLENKKAYYFEKGRSFLDDVIDSSHYLD